MRRIFIFNASSLFGLFRVVGNVGRPFKCEKQKIHLKGNVHKFQNSDMPEIKQLPYKM